MTEQTRIVQQIQPVNPETNESDKLAEQIRVLQQFQPIDLKEMDSVKLMNRTDTKFIFNIAHFEKIMNEISSFYRVLEVDGKRISRYETLYYDTKRFDLYNKH